MKNVIKTRMKMGKKSKQNVKKVASKILKCKRQVMSKKVPRSCQNDKIVIDVNMNLKGLK